MAKPSCPPPSHVSYFRKRFMTVNRGRLKTFNKTTTVGSTCCETDKRPHQSPFSGPSDYHSLGNHSLSLWSYMYVSSVGKKGTGKKAQEKMAQEKKAQGKNGTGKKGTKCMIGKNGTIFFQLFQ